MTELPHDQDAERAVLGAAMLSPTALVDIAPVIAPDDFYDPKHAYIWAAITTLTAAGTPADPVTVAAHLTETGQARITGAPLYLHDLIAAVPTTSNAGYYARVLRDLSARRRMHNAGTRLQALATAEGTSQHLTALALGEVETIHRPDPTATATALGDLIDDVIDDIATTPTDPGIPWPWVDANTTLNPLTAGQLILIAGRASMGKSVACVDVARHAAIHQGKTTVLHSLEMSRDEVIRRIIAAEARIPLNAIQHRELTDGHWARLASARAALAAAPLHIIDTPTVGVADIRASIKTHNPDLLVLDYVQLGAVNPRLDRRQALEEFVRGLKLTAKAAGIPILAAAQLSRAPDTRQDHTPQLSDLRETGALENDADTVVLIYRPDYYDKETVRAGEVDLVVAKQRNGPTQTVTLVHQLHYARLVDAAAA